MSIPRVLIVDDEAPLRDSLSYAFGKEGFDVVTAGNGGAGIEMARRLRADVIVLDLILPDRDGMDVCREIRSWSRVPIVMLTARDQVDDRLQGFDVGADDYLTKPFNTRELVARVRAVMERERKAQAVLAADQALLDRLNRMVADKKVVNTTPVVSNHRLAGLAMDPATSEVVLNERRVALSPAEFRLLEVLLSQGGRVVTRTDLARQLWAQSNDETTVLLEAIVRTVCEKIEQDPARPIRLVTVPGIGYQLR